MSPPSPSHSPITGAFATLQPGSRRALVAAWLITAALLVSAVLLASRPSTMATSAQCEAIFKRLVTLELTEMGYQDPALASRQQAALAARDPCDQNLFHRFPKGLRAQGNSGAASTLPRGRRTR